ncbi:uncharacterized protein [Haliotis asinina]|uniref:uncharacterized protein n=1 Tax=Haliotis asinina TaxID=109174 RepID=UPI0035327B0C
MHCSPFLAQYVTQRHAKLHVTEFPLATETVTASTYMDDSLDSMETDSKAVNLSHELMELWNLAGMHPRKWVSSSLIVMENIPIEDRLKEVNICMSKLPQLKTLGLIWEIFSDLHKVTLQKDNLLQREVSSEKQLDYWKRLCRVLAWTCSFLNNVRLTSSKRPFGELEVQELQDAETLVLLDCQKFPDEYAALSKGRSVSTKSKLLSLKPFLDENGLIRSSERLQFSDVMPYEARCPIILPRRHWTTKLIVKHHHQKNCHLGTNGTLAALSSRSWIISAREEIHEWERQCAWCKRRKPKPSTQIMANLPKVLARSSKAFEQVAVDFAGPFITIQGRGKRRTKRYLCLFTCLTTKAVHLEIALGLDADSFLNAFFRMTSRRGIPKEVLSDNGTNFVKASKELKELVQSNLDSDKVKGSLANKGIIWRFNPPSAPHFGGVYESLIKSAKRAICGILAKGDLSDEELMTAFIGAEELLNSRPLTYQSSHPDDNIPLTPSHFLHGMLGGSLAPDIDCSPYNPKKRWRRIQEPLRHFWRRWMREWLPTLNQRRKWCESSRDYQES